MTRKDPTEDVLATIARIFEQADVMKTRHPLAPKPATLKPVGPMLAPERTAIVNPFSKEEPFPAPPRSVQAAMPASIVSVPPPAEPVIAGSPPPSAVEMVLEAVAAPTPAPEPVAQDPQKTPADSYFRNGPGPLAAIRFRWAARSDGQGGYFVDETIGANSRAITSGPMSGEDAVAFIDLQAQEAFERFERLKQSAAELPVHRYAQAVVEQVHAEHDASEDQGF